MRFQTGTMVEAIRRIALRALAVFGILAIGISVASADTCSALKARYAGAASELRQIEGQARALRASGDGACESGWARGSLFDPCRRQASRAAYRQQAVAQAHYAISTRTSAIRAQMASYGCQREVKRSAPVKRTTATPAAASPRPANTAMLYCVRPSDGYFFPAPNSQFVGVEAAAETRDRCNFICEAAMEVYVLEDIAGGSEAMVSVSDRKPYTALPAAFAYRHKRGAPRCDMQRYHDRVDEARARSVTPKTMGEVTVPLPSSRPRVAQTDLMLSFRGSLSDHDLPQANVRMVGMPYLPE